MTLEQRLTEDMKEAMRAKDELRLSVIRMLRSQILLEKKKGTGVSDVPDDTVVALVRGHAKRLRETVDHSRAAGREDLAVQAEKELGIASAYLPAEMSDADLAEVARQAVAETGATDLKAVGAVMKVAMAKVEGRADGRRVQEAVKRALGSV